MKRKALLLTALCGSLTTTGLLAGDYYSPAGPIPSIKIGPTGSMATEVDRVFGKEYSHTDWFSLFMSGGDPRLTNAEDHDKFAVPDPLQVVSWDGKPGPVGFGSNSGSTDGFDYGVPGFNIPEGQIDALANRNDFAFRQIVDNTATLLFSATADLDASSTHLSIGGATVAKDHVHYEAPTGASASWALIEASPAGPGPGPGVNHHVVEDLDALEVWGPEPPGHSSPTSDPVVEGYVGATPTADADRFSLDMDSLSGVSVWGYDIPTKFVFPYIPHSVIVDSVEDLFLGPGLDYDRETRDAIDVDGTMARDANLNDEWDLGDELLFTIDPLDMPFDVSGAPVAALHGGEIMHLVNTGGGTHAISFLSHGGHTWDTAFSPAAAFGYFYDDIDALEAVGTVDGETDLVIPEPTSIGLLMMASLGVCMLSRPRRRPAA